MSAPPVESVTRDALTHLRTGLLGLPAPSRTTSLRDGTHVLAGPADHHTLASRLQHGLWTGRAGLPDEAVRLLEALLPDVAERVGELHHLHLTGRYQLALWRHTTGRTTVAVRDLEALLRDETHAWGADDYRTKATRGLLQRLGGA